MTSLPPEELANNAVRLARSSTVRTAVLWALTAVVLPAAGWVAAKIDTGHDIAALRLSIDRLTTQQAELVDRMDKGFPALDARINGVQRDIVVATGAALAFETVKRADEKLAAGDRLATDVYDAQVRALVPPAAAASAAVRKGALPHVAR